VEIQEVKTNLRKVRLACGVVLREARKERSRFGTAEKESGVIPPGRMGEITASSP
jgi:hypothetical protein